MEPTPYDLEDDLLEGTSADGADRVRVYTVEHPVVVLGRGSKPDVELHAAACEADGVAVARRRGGGCAVVLDPGDVLIAVAQRAAGIGHNAAHFDRLSRWMIAGLARLGVRGVRHDGISDLVVGDRKIAGTCLYRRKGLLLYSASLLVAPSLDRIERYLAHPPREPAYRRGRPHRAFVTRLVDLPGVPPREDWPGALRRALGAPPAV